MRNLSLAYASDLWLRSLCQSYRGAFNRSYDARTCECNDETQHYSLFSYGTILTGSLDLYHILYTWPIRASMDPRVGSHTSSPFPFRASMLCQIPVRNSSRHGSITQPSGVRVRTIVKEYEYPQMHEHTLMHEVPIFFIFNIIKYNPYNHFIHIISFIISFILISRQDAHQKTASSLPSLCEHNLKKRKSMQPFQEKKVRVGKDCEHN